MNDQCLNDNDDASFVCTFTHVAYKYIKSSLFVVQPIFDGVHLIGGAPSGVDIPVNETEIFKDYVMMWGEAMYASLDQVYNGESLPEITKPHPDGLFAISCIAHGTPQGVLIDSFNWLDLLHDWFFQHNELREHHRLIETCPGGDNSLPCNEYWDECPLPESVLNPCTRYTKKQPCKQDSECVWYIQDSLDTGSCTSCDHIESKASCRNSGCIWDTFGQTCYAPTPSPTTPPSITSSMPTSLSHCNSIEKKQPCKETSGCFWNRDDSIDLLICESCSAIKKRKYCREQAGCVWDKVEARCM